MSLGHYEMDECQIEFFALPPPKPVYDSEKPAHVPENCAMAAFWWVKGSDVKKDANMEVEWITTRGGITVPVLRNNCDLNPFTRLVKYVPAPQKRESTFKSAGAPPAQKKPRKTE